MANSAQAPQYSRAFATLHWLMALLIIAVLALIEFRVLFEKGSDIREGMKTVHFMLGLSVLGLVAVRLAIRLTTSTPPITPQPAAWQTGLSHLLHFAFYVAMIAMPILGWLLLSASGKPVPFFGLTLPALVAENKEAAEWYKEVHATMGDAVMVMIGLHVAAALFHHFAVKDDTLKRMMPAK